MAHPSPLRIRLTDAFIALASWLLLVLPVALSSVEDTLPQTLLATAIVLPLAWRRSNPTAAATVYGTVSLLQLALGYTLLPVNLTALLMLYSVAAFAPRWASIVAVNVGLVGVVLMALLIETTDGRPLFDFFLLVTFGAALVGVSWLLGRAARQRRLTLAQARERAERLEREQAQERALAQAEERARIAREMHDIVAHSLSVIVAQADGARYASNQQPEVAQETLELIAGQGREALAEMRRLLGVLRVEQDAETAPTPGLSDLDAPVNAAIAAGLPVNLQWHGSQRAALPTGAELVAYRVVQEALTNALKHAGPSASVEVHLRWQATGLHIDVRDNGRGAASSIMGTARNDGQGLRGMRERVELYGGSLAAGPTSGGGYRVRADLPYEER